MAYFPRHRVRTEPLALGYQSGVYNFVTGSGEYVITPGQETWDEPHAWIPFWTAKKHDPEGFSRLDMGGPFQSYKWSYESGDLGSTYHFRDFDYFYDGPQFAKFANADRHTPGAWADIAPSSDLQLNGFGSTAISRCAPTNPHASALTAITEIYRDGLPTAGGLNLLRRRGLEGEFLNLEFGILPTWSDLRSLHDANRNTEKYLGQYFRDSNKVVRRKYEFPPEVEVLVDETSWGVPTPALNNYHYASTADSTVRKTMTSKTRRWFSGAFTYYAKEPSSLSAVRDQIQKYNLLYGSSPSLSVFWNVLPYSWAADWMTNIGDVLNNVAMYQNDGLVMVYGYVMEHKTIITEYTATGTAYRGNGPKVCTQRFITESKSRRKATPFGFGLELEGFSPRQWAIIAALGMSRNSGRLAF